MISQISFPPVLFAVPFVGPLLSVSRFEKNTLRINELFQCKEILSKVSALETDAEFNNAVDPLHRAPILAAPLGGVIQNLREICLLLKPGKYKLAGGVLSIALSLALVIVALWSLTLPMLAVGAVALVLSGFYAALTRVEYSLYRTCRELDSVADSLQSSCTPDALDPNG